LFVIDSDDPASTDIFGNKLLGIGITATSYLSILNAP
jgi:hypothetical protein